MVNLATQHKNAASPLHHVDPPRLQLLMPSTNQTATCEPSPSPGAKGMPISISLYLGATLSRYCVAAAPPGGYLARHQTMCAPKHITRRLDMLQDEWEALHGDVLMCLCYMPQGVCMCPPQLAGIPPAACAAAADPLGHDHERTQQQTNSAPNNTGHHPRCWCAIAGGHTLQRWQRCAGANGAASASANMHMPA